MKLLEIMSVNFYITDQLLITYWKNNRSIMDGTQLFIDFKKAYDSVRREVLYSIITEFGSWYFV